MIINLEFLKQEKITRFKTKNFNENKFLAFFKKC